MNRITFDFGCRLALLATNLDDGTHAIPEDLRGQARACVEQMHALAKALLGEFAREFYDESEGEQNATDDADECEAADEA